VIHKGREWAGGLSYEEFAVRPLTTLNRLTVKQLRALVALDDAASLSRAAEALGISQPALSNRLLEIERLTGAVIFNRVGGRLHFAPSGMALLNAARVILDELHQVECSLDHMRSRRSVVIRLEVRGYNLHRELSPIMARMMQDHRDLLIELVSDSARLPLDALLARDVDLTISPGDFSRRGLETRSLAHDELVGVVRLDHPLAARTWLTPRDFEHEPFVTYSAVLERGQEVERFFRPAGVFPRNLVSVGAADYVVSLVASGFGVGILSRWAAERHPDRAALRLLRLGERGVTCEWRAVIRKNADDQEPLRELLNTLPHIFRAAPSQTDT
jgi:LysR family transcriptional regulator for metE and metH